MSPSLSPMMAVWLSFELNCAQNWTDYASGAYVQNSGQDCSWPMLKIEIETMDPGDCE